MYYFLLQLITQNNININISSYCTKTHTLYYYISIGYVICLPNINASNIHLYYIKLY